MSEKMPSFEDVSKEPQKFMSKDEIKQSKERELLDSGGIEEANEFVEKNDKKLIEIKEFTEENEKFLSDQIMLMESCQTDVHYTTKSTSEALNRELEMTKKMHTALVEFKKTLETIG